MAARATCAAPSTAARAAAIVMPSNVRKGGDDTPGTGTLVLVNTRLVDRVLSEPQRAGKLTERDIRGLTPLFWANVLLHGTFAIDLQKRLDHDQIPADDDGFDPQDLDEAEDVSADPARTVA
jgi:hypothetical protein